MHEHGYTTRQVLDWLIAKCAAGASPAGSDTQVQFNDAETLAGDSGLTWDKTAKRLTVKGSSGTGENIIGRMSDNGRNLWLGENGTANPLVSFGDVDQSKNVVLFELSDLAKTVTFSAPDGTCTLGDPYFINNGTTLIVDDANQAVTSNVDIEFTSNAKGPILLDRTTATKYRLYVDNGVLGIESV